MAELRCYALIGDSNVKRNMTLSSLKCRAAMPTARVVLCGRMATLSTSLMSLPQEIDACVVACLTNLLTSTSGSQSTSVAHRVDPVFQTFFEKILAFAVDRPETQVFVSPPMYRTVPLWYRDGMSEVMKLFDAAFQSLSDRPTNLWSLPCFSRAQLEADGIHLNQFSGLEYVLHLFDSSQAVFSSLTKTDSARIDGVEGSNRALENRVSVIEQDHARLVTSFEFQSAITAEALDCQENLKNEAFIMVQGLPRLPKLDQKEWQVRARADVDRVLSDMGFTYRVKYVQNSTGRGANSKTLYKARLDSELISREVRDKFSSYFFGGKDSRPPTLAGISVRNCVTPGTLARVAVMQVLGRRYKESNLGSRFQVVAYESRPLLKLTPPSTASDTRIMSFTYIEAITKLPTNFTQDEIDELMGRVSPRLHGNIRSTLVVLSDDMLVKKGPLKKKAARSSPATQSSPATGANAQEVSSDPEVGGHRTPEGHSGQGRKRAAPAQSSGPTAKR